MASFKGFLKLLKIRPHKQKTDCFDAEDEDKDLMTNDVLCEDEDRISHIYEEIPCSFVDDENTPIAYTSSNLDFKNARDVGPYLVVPILGCYGNQVFRKDEVPCGDDEVLSSELLSRMNRPRNRQFNVTDNAHIFENLDKNSSTYCTIPANGSERVAGNSGLSNCFDDEGDMSRDCVGDGLAKVVRKIKIDSDDSCSEYDIHGVSQKDYFFYLARAEENLKLKQEVLKLVKPGNENSGASNDVSIETAQEDAVSVTTNASDCTSGSSDSGNASLYTCSDMSTCSEGNGSVWYDTTESLSIDVVSGEDFNCKDSQSASEHKTKDESNNKESEKHKNRREYRRKKKKDSNTKNKDDIETSTYKVVTFIRNEADRMSCRAIDCTTLKRRQSKTTRPNNNVGMYGSNNRALNDLMKMNHDRQLFMF